MYSLRQTPVHSKQIIMSKQLIETYHKISRAMYLIQKQFPMVKISIPSINTWTKTMIQIQLISKMTYPYIQYIQYERTNVNDVNDINDINDVQSTPTPVHSNQIIMSKQLIETYHKISRAMYLIQKQFPMVKISIPSINTWTKTMIQIQEISKNIQYIQYIQYEGRRKRYK